MIEAMRRLLRPGISGKFLLAFLALVLVGVANWLAVESTLSRLKGAATLTNLIGSIRWMSQRVQLDTLRVAQGRGDRAAVQEVLDKLDAVIGAVMDGGSALGLDVLEPSPAKLRPSLQAIRDAVARYRREVQAALDTIEAGRSIDGDLEQLYRDGDDILAAANAVARALSAEIAAIEKDATASLYGLVGLDLAILLSLLFAIRTRIVRPLRDLAAASRQFAAGHYGERVAYRSADEIGDLARAFDQMAEEIQRDMSRIAAQVAERQRAAEELRVSKELFQATFDSASVGMTLTDLSGRFLMVNRALCETVGYPGEELLQKSLKDIVHGDDLAVDADLIKETVVGRRASYQIEKRCLHRRGYVVWVLLSAALVRGKDGAPLYFIGQFTDISARKLAEEQRKRIRDDLIESRERLRELVAHHDTVREEERKRIALEIHDELGQMLTALKMDISLLRMKCEGDAELMAKVHDMREMVEQSIRTVRQVAANLRPAALDLGLVPALEWLVENFGQHSGIAYELNLSGGDIAFDDVRATALFRIVQESLTNVARHAGASLAQVSLERTDDAIRLEIRDNGRGFDPEGARRGRSFGLLGIRERTLVLGGELKIDSMPGRGSTLSIRIPLTVCEQP